MGEDVVECEDVEEFEMDMEDDEAKLPELPLCEDAEAEIEPDDERETLADDAGVGVEVELAELSSLPPSKSGVSCHRIV